MKYCGNMACRVHGWDLDSVNFCSECGTGLTPCLFCVCGAEVNPKFHLFYLKRGDQPSHCTQCGRKLDEAYLGQLVSLNFKRLVQQIKTAHQEQESTADAMSLSRN